jgi:hypothetical protein
MRVGDCVLIGVPSAVAEIQSAHESCATIDQAQLFVVRPKQY